MMRCHCPMLAAVLSSVLAASVGVAYVQNRTGDSPEIEHRDIEILESPVPGLRPMPPSVDGITDRHQLLLALDAMSDFELFHVHQVWAVAFRRESDVPLSFPPVLVEMRREAEEFILTADEERSSLAYLLLREYREKRLEERLERLFPKVHSLPAEPGLMGLASPMRDEPWSERDCRESPLGSPLRRQHADAVRINIMWNLVDLCVSVPIQDGSCGERAHYVLDAEIKMGRECQGKPLGLRSQACLDAQRHHLAHVLEMQECWRKDWYDSRGEFGPPQWYRGWQPRGCDSLANRCSSGQLQPGDLC